jgi:hypothetical protein
MGQPKVCKSVQAFEAICANMVIVSSSSHYNSLSQHNRAHAPIVIGACGSKDRKELDICSIVPPMKEALAICIYVYFTIHILASMDI